jgi:hypothetical protein
LTLVVLFLVAAPITLANFTSEIVNDNPSLGSRFKGYYGWPLIWHWHELVNTMAVPVIVGWNYSAIRLAGNATAWLVMLALPAGTCEWLLRCYRPGIRWSLRTMLAGVAVAALCCAWFAAARNRAKLQDPLINKFETDVVVERDGPKWLEFVVPDRFRRHVVGVNLRICGEVDEEFVIRLGRLPHLKYLNLNVEQLTPAMAAALRNSRRLRWLYIHEQESSRESLAALGKLTQLQGLCLYGAELTSDSFACLAALTNLKKFTVYNCTIERAFSQMPPLPKLEAIHVEFTTPLSGQDLRRLEIQPRLKALDLKYAELGVDADLGDLVGLNSLEALTVDGEMVSAARLESLAALKRLKSLHITERGAFFDESEAQTTIELDDGKGLLVLEREMDGFLRALRNLRKSHPAIVIDGDTYAIDKHFEQEPPWEAIRYDRIAQRKPPWDKVERSDLLSTWLPWRFDWVAAAILPTTGAKPSVPANESPQQDAEAEGDE